jgi:hypothetical protein
VRRVRRHLDPFYGTYRNDRYYGCASCCCRSSAYADYTGAQARNVRARGHAPDGASDRACGYVVPDLRRVSHVYGRWSVDAVGVSARSKISSVTMSRSPRYEVRSCRTGYLEEVHGTFLLAVSAANSLRLEDGLSRCIVDTALPTSLGGVTDDRIVWRHGEVTESRLPARGDRSRQPSFRAHRATMKAYAFTRSICRGL